MNRFLKKTAEAKEKQEIYMKQKLLAFLVLS
jgi:hypothetical protein